MMMLANMIVVPVQPSIHYKPDTQLVTMALFTILINKTFYIYILVIQVIIKYFHIKLQI